jgi:hypothetical protein
MAAFIGLLFTGISFMYNKIDSKVEKDIIGGLQKFDAK